jgi:biotin operon repressor
VKTAFEKVKKDVQALRTHMALHDRQIADLMDRTHPRRLEEIVKNTIERVNPDRSIDSIDSNRLQPVENSTLSIVTDSNREHAPASTTKVSLTPTQRSILQALAGDGGDRFLSYRDIGELTGKSPGSVKFQINQLKRKGLSLESVKGVNKQTRYKISSRLKHALTSDEG